MSKSGENVAYENSMELNKFFGFVYGELKGYVYSATKNPDNGQWNQYFFQWPSERKELISHVEAKSAEFEVYTSPSLFGRKESTRDSWLASNVLWCEFDYGIPQNGDLEEFGIPYPSIRIRSSSSDNEHWYWKSQEPIFSIEVLERVTKQIVYALRGDLGTWNANRVLRPPRTMHHESGRTVSIVHYKPKTVSIGDFVNLPEHPSNELQVNTKTPDVLKVIAKYQWSDLFFQRFRSNIIEKGKKSDSLCWIAYECAKLGMENAEILSVLLNCDGRWKKYHGRDDQIKQLTLIIARVRLKYPIEKIHTKLPVIGAWDFIKNQKTIEWVIEGIVPKQSIVILASPPGIGKTQISIQVGIHLALGNNFLKFKIKKSFKILCLSLEMSEGELYYIMKEMLAIYDNDEQAQQNLNESFKVVPFGQSLRMNKVDAQQQLIQVLEVYKPDGIIIDSLGSSLGTGLNDDNEINEVFDFYKRVVIKKYGCFIWIVHHTRKSQVGNKKPKHQDDLLGSQYISAHANVILLLWQEERGGSIEIIPLKTRLTDPENTKPFTVYRANNLSFVLEEEIFLDNIEDDFEGFGTEGTI